MRLPEELPEEDGLYDVLSTPAPISEGLGHFTERIIDRDDKLEPEVLGKPDESEVIEATV